MDTNIYERGTYDSYLTRGTADKVASTLNTKYPGCEAASGWDADTDRFPMIVWIHKETGVIFGKGDKR